MGESLQAVPNHARVLTGDFALFTLKNTMLKVLPRPLLTAIKRVHYPRVIRRFSIGDWPYGAVAKLFVTDGARVIDVGANIGYISGLLARWVGTTGAVYSFEPVPETFALLDHNMRHLGFKQVRRLNCALSSSNGTADMEIPHYTDGGENFYQSHIIANGQENAGGRTVSVALRRLDDVIADDIDAIAFIKIDVEGHELDVIGGAGEVLEVSRPPLLIEVGGSPEDEGSNAWQLFTRLHEYGYQPWVFQGGRLRPRCADDRPVDYFFLTGDQADVVVRSGPARCCHSYPKMARLRWTLARVTVTSQPGSPAALPL